MVAVNVFTATIESVDNPLGYRSGRAGVGAAAGGVETTIFVYELPPGESSCPYHYEYVEEWLLVLEGEVVLRAPDGERSLTRGDLVCFAPGPSGAHKLTNRSEATARLMLFSSAREPSVCVYPDSDKIGVWPGNDADSVILKRRDGAVPYWEGEQSSR
jgi:uncharacterized cupin superfamily protein